MLSFKFSLNEIIGGLKMRYVPIDKIEAGTYLAKSLYDYNGSVLLHKDYKLTENMIKRLKSLGYKGVYIEDKLSEGICIEEIVDERLKIKAANCLEDIAEHDGNVSDIKPIVTDIVDSIIDNQSVMLSMHQLYKYHKYTYSHCVNVGIISTYIGAKLNYSKKELIQVSTAGMLHDIGKKYIPISILDKEEKLTYDEYNIIRNHPKSGYKMIKDLNGISGLSKVAVLDHHERCDGSGYPRGLVCNDISTFGKVIAVADTYDAMTSDRSYRKAFSPSETVEYLMGDGGKLYDFKVIDNFTKSVAVFPDGSVVELSDGSKGIVIKNYHDCILRPVIRTLDDDIIIDLKNDSNYLNVRVEKVIS